NLAVDQSTVILFNSTPSSLPHFILYFFSNVPPTTDIYTLSLHDAFRSRIYAAFETISLTRNHSHPDTLVGIDRKVLWFIVKKGRSEEHTSELQSRENLVSRLLLEKKNSGTKSGIGLCLNIYLIYRKRAS